jgi:hypothetical protein
MTGIPTAERMMFLAALQQDILRRLDLETFSIDGLHSGDWQLTEAWGETACQIGQISPGKGF